MSIVLNAIFRRIEGFPDRCAARRTHRVPPMLGQSNGDGSKRRVARRQFASTL
ncbi:hypothetical protein BURMUCF2_3147 [Burkholderia multivorans CF2]|nr:hypothetical protein BURMUCF2_3147 [Burkholderia multivorans CF2]